jgi:hypothetical protein
MVTSAPVLAGCHLVIAHRARLGALSRQFLVAVGLTITGALTGLWLISRLLFVSAHDAFTMALLFGFAAALTAFCAWMLASHVRGDIEIVRDQLVAVGEGSRQHVPDTGANDETAHLAVAANRIIDQLAERRPNATPPRPCATTSSRPWSTSSSSGIGAQPRRRGAQRAHGRRLP